MIYNLTLEKGAITLRNGIYTGSSTDAVWSPGNPKSLGGWKDGDELHVVCTFDFNPDVNPKPNASQYYGLVVGACNDTDGPTIRQYENVAYWAQKKGQILGNHITTSNSKSGNVIFNNAVSTTGTFPLSPSSRGTLNNLIYKWVMTYNGDNTIADGDHVELVFGYGDPMHNEQDS